MMTRFKFSLRTMFVALTIAVTSVWLFSRLPREMTVVGNDKWTAKYRGFGLNDGRGMFGKQYFEFAIDDLPYRTWQITYSNGDYGNASCFYPNGKIALEGECRIEFSQHEAYPLIDDLKNATSYYPNGEIAARVIAGSGTAIWFYPDGVKNWECEYESGVRTRFLQYAPDGTIRHDERIRRESR